MIPVNLINALATEIEDAVKDYKMQAEGQEDKKVTVYKQHIPDEKYLQDTYYPIVVVSLSSVDDEQEAGSFATVGLTVGVYGESEDAWIDLLSITERIRQRVCWHQTIAKKYRLVMPNKWETIEAQPYPFWFAYGTLKYRIGRPDQYLDKGFGQ